MFNLMKTAILMAAITALFMPTATASASIMPA